MFTTADVLATAPLLERPLPGANGPVEPTSEPARVWASGALACRFDTDVGAKAALCGGGPAR